MSPDITRLLIGADPEASLAECENAARVRATTSAVTAPSTANDPAPSAPQVPPKNLTSRLAPRAPLHAVRGGEEVRKGITAIIPRLAGPFDPMNGRYNREESVIGHSFVMVLRMRVAQSSLSGDWARMARIAKKKFVHSTTSYVAIGEYASAVPGSHRAWSGDPARPLTG